MSESSQPAVSESIATDEKAATKTGFRESATYEYIQIITIAFIVVFGFIRPFIIEPYKIPSGSMEDTLLVGDRVLVLKFPYGVKIPGTNRRLFAFQRPQRGDVFVFSPKHQRRVHFIKRVIAVGGDTIEVRGQTVIVNGQPLLKEPYTKHSRRYALPDFPPFQRWLVPYFFEIPGIAAETEQYARRREVDVDLENGVPVRLRLPKTAPFLVTIEGKDRETAREIPVRDYYYVTADNGREIRRGVLYQNRNSRQWFLIEPEPVYEFRRHYPQGHPYRVPPDHFFAMGDNRENSEDSRAWGPVPFSVVKGKAVLIYWSVDLRNGAPFWQFWKRVRFDRFLRPIRSQYGEMAP